MSLLADQPLLICVAPTGPRRDKGDHRGLPLTAREIGHAAGACRGAGASMIHLHVRDETGAHSLSPQLYRAALKEIRHLAGTEFIVQATCEARGIYDISQQMAAVRRLKADALSFVLDEIVPGESVAAPVAETFAWQIGQGVACQFELQSPAEIARLKSLVERGYIALPRPHALFVLGHEGPVRPVDMSQLDAFLAAWPKDWPWSVCVYGREELAVAERAILLGGHVRVGFEYNLLDADGSLLESNEARVAQIAAAAAKAGRPLATPAQARELFRLPAA